MPFYEVDQRRESEILSFKICDRRASIPISEYSVKKRCLAILRCIQMMPDKSNYSWKTPNSVAREVQGCRWPKIQRNFPRMLNFWHTNIPLLNKRESLLHESGSFRVWGWILRARAVQVGTRISLVPVYVTCMWHMLSLAHVGRHYYSFLYDYIGCTLDSSHHFLTTTDRWLQVERYYAV